jgi:hypothetical protein
MSSRDPTPLGSAGIDRAGRVEPVQAGILRIVMLEVAKEMIEGTILHHQHDDVLDASTVKTRCGVISHDLLPSREWRDPIQPYPRRMSAD